MATFSGRFSVKTVTELSRTDSSCVCKVKTNVETKSVGCGTDLRQKHSAGKKATNTTDPATAEDW